jgi:hypothetical protein
MAKRRIALSISLALMISLLAATPVAADAKPPLAG